MLGPGQSTVFLADYGCFVPALVAAMVHPKAASIDLDPHLRPTALVECQHSRCVCKAGEGVTRSSSSAPTKTTCSDVHGGDQARLSSWRPAGAMGSRRWPGAIFRTIHPVSLRATERHRRSSPALLREEKKVPTRNVAVHVMQKDGRLFQDLCPSLAAAARPGLWWRRWYALSCCQVRPRSAPLSCCWSALQGRLQGWVRGASARVRQGLPRPHQTKATCRYDTTSPRFPLHSSIVLS